MRALITGGAGFIGSHLTDFLVARGWSVVVLDDLSTGHEQNLAWAMSDQHRGSVELQVGSVTDPWAVAHAAEGAEVVFHLAAAVGVFNIQQKTLQSLETNLHGTEVVLETAMERDARFILASTSEVYGKNTAIGLTEDSDRVLGSPLLSRWSYAEAKALDETLTQQHHLHYAVPTVILRLFNTTGPRQTGRYGMVVPRFVRQALTGQALTVYGDGEQTRCFAHVQDVVPTIAQLAEVPGAVGNVYNIGNPHQVSINGLAHRVLQLTESSSPVAHIDYETAYGPGFEDMERRIPDCTRLRNLTGFVPRHDLDQIITSVIAEESRKVRVG